MLFDLDYIQTQSKIFFQFSDRVNKVVNNATYHNIMLNGNCGITNHPFGRECDNNWYVYDRDSKTWTNDQSITLECNNKGN